MPSFLATIKELEGLEKRRYSLDLPYEDFVRLHALVGENLPQILAMARWACENGYPSEKV